ncbi:MAG TPA: flagellar filament capping protein FliD [Bacillota bacterium]|nr:flagellar filament capping protein FliD [Bacillota bacterium]
MSIGMSPIGGQSSQIEELIKKYMAMESKPIETLKKTKESLSVRSAMFQDLNSSLLSLKNASDALIPTDTSSLYDAKTAVTGDANVLTAQAGPEAQEASYSIFVERLAQTDTVVSGRFLSSATEIAENAGSGDKAFTITVGDISCEVLVCVSEGDDNSTVLTNLATAINRSEAGAYAGATVVCEEAGTSRLVISSKSSGSANAVVLSESGGSQGILRVCGISSEVQSLGESGGYLVARDLLDAKFNLNGLDFLRSSNVVTDAIEGVTLTLRKSQESGAQAVSLEIKPDTNVIKAKIKAFITSFNATVKFLQNKTMVDANAGIRGDLAGEAVYLDLKTKMARAVQTRVEGCESQTIARLFDLGITRDRNGQLSIANESKLDKALLENPGNVLDLFASEDGIARRVRNLMEPFVKSTGIIDKQRKSISNQISACDSQVKSLEGRLEMREKTLRTQFASLLRALTLVNTQSAMLNSFMTQSSYMSLLY